MYVTTGLVLEFLITQFLCYMNIFFAFFLFNIMMIFSYVFPTVFDLISHLDSPSGVYFILIKQVLFFSVCIITAPKSHVCSFRSTHRFLSIWPHLPVLGNVGPHRRD